MSLPEDQSHIPPLATKFVSPQLPLALVHRDRLLMELDATPGYRLVLLSASAGSGKTTLLSAWAARMRIEEGQALIWLSLDEMENDPARFWASVIAALRTCLPPVGEMALALLRAPQPAPLTTILTTLINDILEQSSEVILVLDDYQVIEEQTIHEGISFLLDHLPAKLHLVLASRSDPDLPLARWRVRGQMLEIRDPDLAFRQEETERFLTQVIDGPFLPEEVQLLQRHTEGWIAGVQLAALALRKREDRAAFLQAFTGSHRYLMDYVQQEILKQLPWPLHQFLLQIAVLSRMNADLCQAITGEPASQKFLETLERNNLFLVPLDEQRQWYRLHDLFREVLLARLQATQPDLVPQLRLQVASFYEGQGEIREAVAYALAAPDFPYAATLMERSVEEIWLRGEIQTLYHWIMALSDVEIHKHSRLVLTAALYLLNATATNSEESRVRAQAQGKRMIARVEATLRVPGEITLHANEVALLQRRVRLLHLWIAAHEALARHDHDQFRLIDQQMQQLEQDNEVLWQMIPLSVMFILHYTFQQEGGILVQRLQEAQQQVNQTSDRYGRMKIMQWLALAYLRAGQLHLTYQECLAAQALLQQIEGHAILAGYFSTCLAEVLYQWNRLEEGYALSQKIIHDAAAWQQIDLQRGGYVLSAEYALAARKPEIAQQALQEIEHMFQNERLVALFAPLAAAVRVRYWLAAGDLAAASDWAAHVIFHEENWDPQRKGEFLALVRVYCAQRQYTRAITMLDRFSVYLDRPGYGFGSIHFLSLSFIALHHAGKAEQARRVAVRLFALTEPEGFLRVYLDEGELMRRALQALSDTSEQDAGFSRSYVSTLLAVFEQEKQQDTKTTDLLLVNPREAGSQPPQNTFPFDQPVLIEPLSPQEQRVLRLLVARCSNPEIASALVISVNTVKTHLQSLYRKLGVTNRVEASTTAHTLCLLSPLSPPESPTKNHPPG